jgi:toxin ParE1/3/4
MSKLPSTITSARRAATSRSVIEALQSACRAIADRPGLGSPRYAQELALPGLRSRDVKGFPYLVFYIERDDIGVWRVLHGRRDIPSRMREAEL